MGLFGNLMDKVFGRDDDNAKEEQAAVPKPEVVIEESRTSVDLHADTVPLNDDTGAVSAQAREAEAEAEAAPEPEPVSDVDVAANLDRLANEHPEDLDWKLSIVDLCKLVDIDSSYSARKEMALELGYTQEKIDSDGSAEMNIWLHREVMRQIAANGGKLPDGLTD